jgi:hypothetical protein
MSYYLYNTFGSHQTKFSIKLHQNLVSWASYIILRWLEKNRSHPSIDIQWLKIR